MTVFRSRNRTVATVPVEPESIWNALTDPALLAELTPLVSRIAAKGDVWTWTLSGFTGLGLDLAPSFTERMTFMPISRIDFRHDPPPGRTERAGASGTYRITRVGERTAKLAIDVSLHIELPLPAFSGRAVERVMAASMRRTGDAFAENLYQHLEIDPDQVTVRVIEGDVSS